MTAQFDDGFRPAHTPNQQDLEATAKNALFIAAAAFDSPLGHQTFETLTPRQTKALNEATDDICAQHSVAPCANPHSEGNTGQAIGRAEQIATEICMSDTQAFDNARHEKRDTTSLLTQESKDAYLLMDMGPRVAGILHTAPGIH